MAGVDPRGILDLLPHRYPFLMVDRVDEIVPGERIVAFKNVSAGEPYFAGHFPGDPVMPGVLQVEALAQAAAVLAEATHPGLTGVVLMGLDKVRFRRKVVPGDVLRLEVEVVQARAAIWKIRGVASVNGERAAEAQILATIRHPED
jgi:3-hydroxyacyl-[acyl-carrier-protein] dehydratase